VSTPGLQETYQELGMKNSFQQIQEPYKTIRKTFISRADVSYKNMKWFCQLFLEQSEIGRGTGPCYHIPTTRKKKNTNTEYLLLYLVFMCLYW
jgi:hypothetical protein